MVSREDTRKDAGTQGQFCHIVADDLTGACDAAIQFRLRGAHTRVALTPHPQPCDVLAFDTETRALSDDAIRERIFELATLPRPRVVFKKIDSLMRGNPALEVATALEAYGLDEAIMTPAFPAMGRRVVNGLLFADTVPGWVPLKIGARDAAFDNDLLTLVRDGLSSGRRILWAGSGGLAGAVAEVLVGPIQPPSPPPQVNGPVVFCVGSDHPVTLAQTARLKDHGHSVITPETVPAAVGAILITGGDTAALVCRNAQAQAIELEGEIVPGLPWGRIIGGRFDGSFIATKSGAFGTPDALLRVAAFFGKVGVSE